MSQLSRDQLWKAYVAGWQSVFPTERVDQSAVGRPYMKRMVKSLIELDDEEGAAVFNAVESSENLQAKLNSEYEVKFVQATNDYHVKPDEARNEGIALHSEDGDGESSPTITANEDDDSDRSDKEILADKLRPLIMNNVWMQGGVTEDVDSKKSDYEQSMKQGVVAGGDAEMADAP